LRGIGRLIGLAVLFTDNNLCSKWQYTFAGGDYFK